MTLLREFYFVRHGQTAHNLLEGKDKGGNIEQISLNETGKEQAKSIEPLIFSLPIQSVVGSPVRRAQETKDIITARLQAPYYEIENFGECTDVIWKELRNLNADTPYPDMGAIHNFLEKVRTGLHLALSIPGPALIVSHGGVHKAICYLLKVQDYDWHIENCEVVHFLKKDDKNWIGKRI
jgi:uncharacterized phosphatase